MKPSSVYIETYGCQMNKLDSENVTAILASGGYTVVEDLHEADVILLNTCAVRDNAEKRIHGRIGELSSLRRGKPELLFGIIGCMAQRLGERLTGVVSIVAGPDSYRRLPDMIRLASSGYVVDIALSQEETYRGIEPVRRDDHSAWIDVMRGCDNYCSYCVVPYTRGRERSIPLGEIIAELERLNEHGYREVTLLGQNVNSYHDGDVDFAELLDCAADTGIGWIRFLTSHPKDIDSRIFDVMARRANVCNQLHLPLQSGSDRILNAMNRLYTVDQYRAIVEQARTQVHGINISTDIIFGFPGETNEDFRATINLIEDIRFDFTFMYRYSEREGTKASLLPGKVPGEVRIERLKQAIELQNAIMRGNNKEHIGSILVVLVKGPSKDSKGWYGFTETNIPVVFTADDSSVGKGSFVSVRIEDTTGASLIGKAV